jgi:hypothetical protein
MALHYSPLSVVESWLRLRDFGFDKHSMLATCRNVGYEARLFIFQSVENRAGFGCGLLRLLAEHNPFPLF